MKISRGKLHTFNDSLVFFFFPPGEIERTTASTGGGLVKLGRVKHTVGDKFRICVQIVEIFWKYVEAMTVYYGRSSGNIGTGVQIQ